MTAADASHRQRQVAYLVGGPSWAYTDEMLLHAERNGVVECCRCGTLWALADLDADNWCGRCG